MEALLTVVHVVRPKIILKCMLASPVKIECSKGSDDLNRIDIFILQIKWAGKFGYK